MANLCNAGDSDEAKTLAQAGSEALPADVVSPPTSTPWPLVSQRRLAAWSRLKTKKGRLAAGAILVEGIRLVSEALACGVELSALLFCDDTQGREALQRVRESASMQRSSILRVRPGDFARLTDTVHAAGVAAILRWQPPTFEPEDPSHRRAARILFCDRISDPGNLGTLIRSAAGLGVDAIFTHPEAVEVTNPKTVRASAGALFRVPVFAAIPAERVADWCRGRKLPILIADAHQGRGLSTYIRIPRWVLVVGGETRPLDPHWARVSVRRLHVPLRRGVESLNAGVAGAILIDRLCRTSRQGR